MPTKEKIVCVHLLNDYSGSPLVLSTAIKAFLKQGYEVDLWTSGNTEGFLSSIPKVNYEFINYAFTNNKLKRLFAFLWSQISLFFALWKYRNEEVIIYINTLLPFGAALAGKWMGKKVVYHVHETSLKPAALKAFLKGCAQYASVRAIYVSRYLMNREGMKNVDGFVVYNALSDKFVEQAFAQKKNHLAEAPFTILMLCSLKIYKGVQEFVELSKRLPECRFELVLNAEKEEIESFFKEEKLPGNLIWFSAQKNVHPFYHRADLVLNLSHPDKWVETFGMTILEAMVYDIPSIVPPVGGPVELVSTNKNGFLIEATNLDALQEKITWMLQNGPQYVALCENATKKAKSFSLPQMEAGVIKAVTF